MSTDPPCAICTEPATAHYRWATVNREPSSRMDQWESGDLCTVCALAVHELAATSSFEQVGAPDRESTEASD